MATIQRPTKEGSVRTYQEKVGLGFVDILASEMDADLDTIYAAWNGGVDSVTLKDGAVTTPKIVDLNVTTAKLADLGVTTLKLAALGVTTAKLADLNVTTPKLTDLAVTTAKLAVAATTPVNRGASLPGAVNLTASETVLLSIANVTTRGGLVLFVVSLMGNVNLTAATDAQSQLRIYVGTTLIASYSYYGYGIAGQSFYVPVNYSFSLPWQSGAGTNTIELRGIRTLGTQNWQVTAGTFSVIEHA
jgi:hypothetical protein